MSINSPLHPRAYEGRSADCERAIERDFLRQVLASGTPFIDLDSVLSAIADDATRAGWTEQELSDAVRELARRYDMSPYEG